MAGGDRESSTPSARPRVAIVSTSVHARPSAYAAWARQGDLIVAGDRNTDPALADYVSKELGGEYLTPLAQEVWPFSPSIGWRSVQRRNAAVMTAYTRGYDFVVTVDDDNTPTTDDWVERHVGHIQGRFPRDVVLVSGDGWVDTGQFVEPAHQQRGTPYGVARRTTVVVEPTDLRVVASTGQVLGDPDCDAITRLVNPPTVKRVTYNVVVDRDDYAAFNSQATVWAGQWAPLLAVVPHVGRYDDIIASFIAKRIMRSHGVSFYAGEPCVYQDRNEHDIIADLRREVYGMHVTPNLVRCLDTVVELGADTSLAVAYGRCVETLARHGVLNTQAIAFMRAWCKTWMRHQW